MPPNRRQKRRTDGSREARHVPAPDVPPTIPRKLAETRALAHSPHEAIAAYSTDADREKVESDRAALAADRAAKRARAEALRAEAKSLRGREPSIKVVNWYDPQEAKYWRLRPDEPPKSEGLAAWTRWASINDLNYATWFADQLSATTKEGLARATQLDKEAWAICRSLLEDTLRMSAAPVRNPRGAGAKPHKDWPVVFDKVDEKLRSMDAKDRPRSKEQLCDLVRAVCVEMKSKPYSADSTIKNRIKKDRPTLFDYVVLRR